MSDNSYSKWYGEFKEFIDIFEDDQLFSNLDTLIRSSRNTFAMNRKIMEKVIDVSWVEAIENGILHLDNFLRSPRKTIEDVEEVVPIALSKKITVESVKHLAQHTDLIQSIDKRTGKITPSKILNVHKEESMMTYENKFVNTLIDRLYIFINTRYEKLAQVTKDEKVMSMGYDTAIDDGAGGKLKIELKVETTESLDSYDSSGMTIWQRVEKLKKVIEGYKGSVLCQTLGNTYIRPPVMRTNAIMKNVDLKACLTLWQYIESYDKVGYSINVENTAVKPQNDYIDDFYNEEAPANAYIRWVIMSLITIAIYLFGAYFLYKFRKAEDVSKPYVYKAFFYFIMTCAVFCILSLFIINDDDDFFGGILICAIGWFIMEVITRRGFKRFWTAGLGFCAAVGGVLAICGICKATDGFGASKHVPANMNISSVSIESYDLLPVQYDDISFRDKDVINAVTALNKEIIDRHYNSENYQYKVAANTPEQNSLSSIYDCQHISITYKTRTGSTVMREYSFASGIAGDLVQAVILSDEYAEYVSKELKLTSFNYIYDDIAYRNIEDAVKRATVDKLPISYSLPCGMNLQRKTIERDKLIEIADAYEKDLKELTAEDLKASREVAEIYGYWVLECFDDTIAKMNEYGLEIAEIDSDKNANGLSNIAIIPNPVFYSSEINIYSTSSGRYYGHISGQDFTLPDKITSANWQYSYDAFNNYSELHPIHSYDAAADIVSISTPVIVGEYPLAIIWTGSNNCYYVTDHGNNKEILDKAMKELYR